MMKIISSLLIIVSLYFAFGIIAIRYYIDDLVFMKVPQSETREFVRYSVLTRNAETLIRGYGGFNEGRCVIFFPGRSGGIPRYEIELFDGLVSKGIPVYALSYPGYEGASGESSFSNIMESTELAISLLVKEQHCNITKTVFVGRSLGASIAIKVAAEYKVKGLVLDSVGLSLTSAIEYQLNKHFLLRPLSLLPLEGLLSFNNDLLNSFNAVSESQVYIYQGEVDEMLSFNQLSAALQEKPSYVNLVPVANATHSNAFKLAGEHYLNTIVSLLRPDS